MELDNQKKFGLIFIPIFLFCIILLARMNLATVFEPPFLLFAMNAVFLGFIPILIASIMVRVYQQTSVVTILCIGLGILIFGLGSIVAGWLNPLIGGPNMTATVHIVSACIGSVFILAGSLLRYPVFLVARDINTTRIILVFYGGTMVFILLFSLAAMQGMTPPFFIPGSGPTMIRQVVLSNATVIFAISSLLFMMMHIHERYDFFFWFSLSFALIATGLFAIFFQPSVGSLIGWVGRSAQYLGFVFALYAFLIAREVSATKGIAIGRVIADLFVDPEESYKQLVETATDAIITVDADDRVLLWNKAAERFFGYTREEATGLSFHELMVEDTTIPPTTVHDNGIPVPGNDTCFPVIVETVGKRKDSTSFPVELTVSPRYQRGRLVQTYILRDLTRYKYLETQVQERTEELKRNLASVQKMHKEVSASYNQLALHEKELRNQYDEIRDKTGALEVSELKYRNLVESLQEGIWTIDRDANTSFVNSRMAEMLGYSVEEMIGRSLFDFMDKEGRTIVEENIKRRKSGIKEQHDFLFIKKDGSRMYASLATSPLTDHTGTYIGALAGVMDITKRKQMENELAFKNIILSTQQETSLDGILIIDENGKIISFNQHFIDIWGIPEEVIRARSDELALSSVLRKLKNPDEFLKRVGYLYEHREETSREEVFLQDGRVFDRYSAPMADGTGTYYGRVWYFRDTTDKKQAEDLLLHFNQQLEEQVQTRTEQLNASLAEKEVLLKEIHHRVRNNMQVVSSLLFMQARGIHDKTAKEILLESQNRIKSIALVHEILYEFPDLSRIDFARYLEKITSYLFAVYQVDQQAITCRIHADNVYLTIDQAVPCGIVINELITNSFKHAFKTREQGTILITGTTNTTQFTISYQDDGIGMPKDFVLDSAETIGMKLIKGLVNQINGQIVYDQSDKTRYIITFPVYIKE